MPPKKKSPDVERKVVKQTTTKYKNGTQVTTTSTKPVNITKALKAMSLK